MKKRSLTLLFLFLFLGLVISSPLVNLAYATIIFEDGWETSQDFTTNWTGTYISGANLDVVDTWAYEGTYSARITNLNLNSERASCYKTLGSTYNNLFAQAIFRFTAEPTSTSWGGFIDFYGSDHLGKVVYDSSNNRVGVRYYSGSWTTTWGANNGWTIAPNTNYRVEFEVLVSATGYFKVYVDDTLLLTVEVDTNDRGNIARAYFGDVYLDADDASGLTEYFDFCRVADEYIGVEGGTDYPVACTQSVTLGKSVGVTWSSNVGLTESLTFGKTAAAAFQSIIGLTQSLMMGKAAGIQSSLAVGLTEALTYSSGVAVGSAYSIGESLSLTLAKAVTSVLNGGIIFADLTLSLTSGIGGAVQWVANSDLSQSLTGAFSAGIASAFGVSESLGLALSDVVAVTLGGAAYFADLTLSFALSVASEVVRYEWQYAARDEFIGAAFILLFIGGFVFIVISKR